MRLHLVAALSICAGVAGAQVADSPWLYGIHWYDTTNIAPGQTTDTEVMSGGKGLYVLEQVFTDPGGDNFWEEAPYKVPHYQKIIQGKGHTVVSRLQMDWGRNVPHSGDPYTLANFATGAAAAANTLKDWCHIWQIGNEVNLTGENNRWSGSAYSTPWQPTPAEYAAAYVATRDAIHTVTPNTNPATQIVLMQPNSPGAAEGDRFMDGNEYLWRSIEAVADKSKIDGFGLHSYAEPGAADYGVGGWIDALREQLMIIDQFGLGNRPTYITEFNKHMPNSTEAQIGAKFLHRAFTTLNNWNTSTGGAWPGLGNHNVVGSMWFIYPYDAGAWKDYSLLYWKGSGADHETDPWKSFQYAATLNYAKGVAGGGPASIPQNAVWWSDSFNGAALDESGALPDWKSEPGNGGAVAMSGAGAVRLLGNGSPYGIGSIRTAGYVYGNFRAEMDFTITNANRIANDEANMDIRIREGSLGYSLTLFPAGSTVETHKARLRRTNNWGEILTETTIPGGINTGDSFRLSITANGSDIEYRLMRTPSNQVVLDWTGPNKVVDAGQKVGWLRVMTYNLQEAQLSEFQLGGPQWLPPSKVEDWQNLQ